MSTSAIEVELLDSMLDDSPPCEAWPPWMYIQCGKPSWARMYFICPEANQTMTSFLCKPCLDFGMKTFFSCATCYRPITEWKFI